MGNLGTIALAAGLAIVFGYVFTMVSLVRGAMAWRLRTMVAVAIDAASIAIMRSGVEPHGVSSVHCKAFAARHQAELVTSRPPG